MIQKLTGQIFEQGLFGKINAVPTEVGGAALQAKTVYPSHSEQVITPDDDYDGLAVVTVKAVPRIPAVETKVHEGAYAPNLVEVDVPVVVDASVLGEDVIFSYAVVSVDGASYGFSGSPATGAIGETIIFGGNNYYQSNNYNVGNSYAICKVEFSSAVERTIILNCISYGESKYDYGLVSTINTTLSLSTTDDGATGSEMVTKNFKGLSSAEVVPVEITIPVGDSFITIKYRKNGSGNDGNDRFKFAVVM